MMNYCWKRAVMVPLLVAACAGQAWGAEPRAKSAGSDPVTVNFVNADIEGVVKAVGEITGKNFVLDPRVKGTINIISSRPISRALVYEMFLSALRLQGFAAVEDRGLVKILPEGDAKLHRGTASGPQERSRGGGDQIETRIFNLRHESAAQLVPILRPLISPNNTVAAAQSSNALIITDYASNLQRLERIIDALDQPNGADPIVIPLRNASALDVAQTINRLFATAGPAPGTTDLASRFTVVADARSNSVLAQSGDPARLVRVRQLAAMLDSPTSAGGNIHVVYLKNAEAVKVAEVLRAIYLGDAAPAAAPRLSSPAVALSAAGTPLPGMPAGSAPLAGPQAIALTAGMIQADPATNSILINAPDAIYNNLRAVLDKLDVRRAQVFVEALIAEVTADKAAEFGVQWQDLGGAGKNSSQVFGGTNFGTPGQNILGIAANPAGVSRGLNLGVINGLVTIPGVGQILNLNVLVRALESDNKANILSTPTLLTLDNEEARIIIGQNVPFITGQYALSGAATTPTPFQTIERHDVGLTLRVKPQISEGGTVRLQIYQEVSTVVDNSNPAGLITNKRAVESSVLVDDGQIVVLGGLIQDSVRSVVEKVPLLGDLPLIGALFTYNTATRSKTNLMVFLRPTVLRDAQRLDAVTGSRYDQIRGEQNKAAVSPMAPFSGADTPALPPR